jgi:hypothetical protein
MARVQQSSTFIVPDAAPGVTAAPSASKKSKRDAAPFVIVPESMVIAEDKLEPHWLPAIDAATD